MKRFVIALLYFYRWLISPFFPPSCRYEPTCSRYAIQAIELHGLWKGILITFKRMMRCQPLSNHAKTQGTYDPVPEKPIDLSPKNDMTQNQHVKTDTH